MPYPFPLKKNGSESVNDRNGGGRNDPPGSLKKKGQNDLR